MEHFKNLILSTYLDSADDLAEIQQLQDKFSELTGVACVLVDNLGNRVTAESGKCRLCREIVRKSTIGQLNCIHAIDPKELQNIGAYFIRRCPISGLWDAVIPLHVKNVRIGNFYIGNVRSSSAIMPSVMTIAKEMKVNKAAIEKAYNEIAIMSEAQFVDTVKLFNLFVTEIAKRVHLNKKFNETIHKVNRLNEELQQKEEKLRHTLQAIGDGVIITDVDAKIVDMNPAAQKMSGWTIADALGKHIFDVFDLQGVDNEFDRDEYFRQVKNDGQVHFIEKDVMLISKSNTEVYIADSAAPIYDSLNNMFGIVIVFSDVSKKHLTEKALRESERSKSMIIENIPGVAYRCSFDPEWPMEYISKGCLTLTGYKAEDFMQGKINFKNIILPQYRGMLWEKWQKVVTEKSFLREQYQIQTPDNKTRWVWEQGAPIYDENNQVVALEGLIIDISEQKKYEEMLHDAHRLAHMGHVSYSFIDEKMHVTELIPVILGMDEIQNYSVKILKQIVHPEMLDKTMQYFEYKMKERKTLFDTKIKILRVNDQAERWIHLLGKIAYSTNGAPIAISCVMIDITERRMAKEALRRSREELKMYASHLQNIREEERAFMSREMHDMVSQPLLAVKMQIGMAQQMLQKDSSKENLALLHNNIKETIDVIEKTINASRKISTTLRSDMLDIVGFVEGLRLMITNFGNTHNLQCNFECNTARIELTLQQSIALYRIVQEALNNIANHAKAKTISIDIIKLGSRLIISIQDDGIGFDTDHHQSGNSFGLVDIRERAHLLGAKLRVTSEIGGGTRIYLEMSLKNMATV